MTRRIFISSVQRELAAERKAVVDGVSANPQLARFFSTFAFEFDMPVQDKRTDEVYLSEVGAKGTEVGQKVDFGALASVGRKDFRMMCERVFKCLAKDSRMSRRRISQVLGIAESTVQCATNALQEVGLLRREGRGKGSNWIVVPEPSQPITKPLEPRTKARKPITKRRVSAKKGKEPK